MLKIQPACGLCEKDGGKAEVIDGIAALRRMKSCLRGDIPGKGGQCANMGPVPAFSVRAGFLFGMSYFACGLKGRGCLLWF